MLSKIDVIVNPIRMRIIQYAAYNQPVTVTQIAQAIPDVSKATLYRHIRILTENEILSIVGEEKKRGTFEQSYALNLDKINVSGQESNSELQSLVYTILTKLIADFTQYFNGESANPFEDKVFVSTNTLDLNNDDYDDFTKEIFGVVEKYIKLPVKEKGETRMITIVSSPTSQARMED